MHAAGGRDEVAPRDEAPRDREPLLGAPDVERVLAGAQHPAVDLADRGDGAHLAARRGGHRLVEQRHPLGDPPGGDMGLSQQRDRAELEVAVPEPPGDRERRHRLLGALGRVARPRRPVEREPAVIHALLGALEQALGARHPAVRGREIGVDREVEERQPARHARGLPHRARRDGRRTRARRARSPGRSRRGSGRPGARPSSASALSSTASASSKQARATSQSAAASASRPRRSRSPVAASAPIPRRCSHGRGAAPKA